MNKKPVLLCVVLSFVLIMFAGCGDDDDNVRVGNLLPGVYVQDGSASDLDVGDFSSPFVHDWNDDGKKDLIVGQNNNSNGYVGFYENIGTDAEPSFNGSTLILSCNGGCSPVNVPVGEG